MPPQVNATVTRVTGATAATGNRDNWDAAMAGATGPAGEPAGAGAEKWSGEVPAFLEEKIARSLTDVSDVAERRRLHLDTSDARALGVDTDDVITFTGPDGLSRTATALLVVYSDFAGIPAALQTTTLELRAG